METVTNIGPCECCGTQSLCTLCSGEPPAIIYVTLSGFGTHYFCRDNCAPIGNPGEVPERWNLSNLNGTWPLYYGLGPINPSQEVECCTWGTGPTEHNIIPVSRNCPISFDGDQTVYVGITLRICDAPFTGPSWVIDFSNLYSGSLSGVGGTTPAVIPADCDGPPSIDVELCDECGLLGFVFACVTQYTATANFSAGAGAAIPPALPLAPTQVASPTFSPPSGNYPITFGLTISTSTPGAEIRWTSNGTDPTPSSALYSGSIGILGSVTIKARAFKAGIEPSAIVTATYTIGAPPAEPTHDLELHGVSIGNGTCAACALLNATYLLTGLLLDNSLPNVLLMEVPATCANGDRFRWLIYLEAGLPARIELRLNNTDVNGTIEYLLASYVGSSSTNWITGTAATLPLQSTFYDPSGACNLAPSSVYLRSYLY